MESHAAQSVLGPGTTPKNEVCLAEINNLQVQAKHWQFQCGEEIMFGQSGCNSNSGGDSSRTNPKNWEQITIKMVASSTRSMEKRGAKHVEMTRVNDKRETKAFFVVFCLGELLQMYGIHMFKGKNH